MVRDSVLRFAADVMRPAAAAADEAALPPAELLEASMELGLNLMVVPEGLGGMGAERSPVSSTLVLEDLARGDMGLALAVVAPLSVVQALVDLGDAEQQSTYLAPFAEEKFFNASMALTEEQVLFDPAKMKTRARRSGDGFELEGEKVAVPLGQSAELFVVAAELEGRGPALFVVEASTDGIEVAPQPSMGLRSAGLSRVRFSGVKLPKRALLGEPGAKSFANVIDRARIGWAALTVGAAQTVVDYVVPYCNEREAFGEPITNRQSVAFMIADLALELEGMRLMTYRAASLLEQGRPAHQMASLAKLQAAEKGMKVGTDGVQLLGGHGFVKEHPVELWYRHFRAIAVMEGGLWV